MLESVAFGADARIAPRDRLEALERLKEFDRTGHDFDGLTEEEVYAELDSFYSSMFAVVFVGSTDLEPDRTKFPATCQALRQVVGRMVELAIAEREAAGHWGEALEPLPAPEPPDEPEPDDAVVEPEPPPQQRAIEPPKGIDPALGWPR